METDATNRPPSHVEFVESLWHSPAKFVSFTVVLTSGQARLPRSSIICTPLLIAIFGMIVSEMGFQGAAIDMGMCCIIHWNWPPHLCFFHDQGSWLPPVFRATKTRMMEPVSNRRSFATAG